MNIDPKVEPWLRKLLDGVENSNNAAEVIATAAYSGCHTPDVQVEFRKCLSDISFTRAGYDVRKMPPAQKSSEAAAGADAMTRARQIWSENPDKHDELRAVFKELGPLATVDEIERAP